MNLSAAAIGLLGEKHQARIAVNKKIFVEIHPIHIVDNCIFLDSSQIKYMLTY